MAASPNQFAVANAISAGGVGSGLDLALLSQSAAGARQAFDALSGEIHASTQTMMLDDSLYLRAATLGRMRQASFEGGVGPMAALASGGPTLAYADGFRSSIPQSMGSARVDPGGRKPAYPVKELPATALWAQGVGAWGKLGGDGNTADMSRTLAGFFSGVDRRFGPNWLAGFAGGYTNSSLRINDRASSGNIDTAHLAGYLGTNYGPWTIRAAAAASFSTLDTRRWIAFPGFADSATAHYAASTTQVFGEVGYGVTLGSIAVEPFGGIAFVHLSTPSFSETGGIAGLSGSGSSDDIGYSTLGSRTATNYILTNGMLLTPRLSAAWQHAFGSTPTAALTFNSTGAPFTIAGVPLARDLVLLDGGLDLQFNSRTTLSLVGSSQLGDRVRDYSAKGNLTWRF